MKDHDASALGLRILIAVIERRKRASVAPLFRAGVMLQTHDEIECPMIGRLLDRYEAEVLFDTEWAVTKFTERAVTDEHTT